MNYVRQEVDSFLRGYGMMLDSLDRKACWRKKYQAIYIQTRQLYCEADTLKELMNLFDEKKRYEALSGRPNWIGKKNGGYYYENE